MGKRRGPSIPRRASTGSITGNFGADVYRGGGGRPLPPLYRAIVVSILGVIPYRTYPADPPVFDGVRVMEIWNRAYSDYTNLNGRAWGYSIYVLENWDKIFARYDGATHTLLASDGSRKTTFVGLITLTGGAGKFRGVRGLIRTTSVFDPKANISETRDEGEYWIE